MGLVELSPVSPLILFPIGRVLFPGARMIVSIAEPRYFELVRRYYGSGERFGIAMLRKGDDLLADDYASSLPELMPVGLNATIINWIETRHNSLSLLVEGGRKFRIEQCSYKELGLIEANIRYLASDRPGTEINFEIEAKMLSELIKHPYIQRLQLRPDLLDCQQVSCLLSQYLPLSEQQKYQLLIEEESFQRICDIRSYLKELSG